MNIVRAITDYLAPVMGAIEPTLGEWDDGDEDGDAEYLSINLNGGPKPGVIAEFPIIDLWYASRRGVPDQARGKIQSYETANRILQYIKDNPKSSCFANVVPITGIIGPRTSNEKRHVYKITLQITV